MGRKIAIVGATPAAFMQLASLVFSRGQYDAWKDDEFTLIHDPDKVYPYMMSGTVPPVFSEISSVINLENIVMQLIHLDTNMLVGVIEGIKMLIYHLSLKLLLILI